MTSYNIFTEVLYRNMVNAVQLHSVKPPAKITGDSQTGFSKQPPAVPALPPLCQDSCTGDVPLLCWHQLLPQNPPHTSSVGPLPAQSRSWESSAMHLRYQIGI